MCLPNKQIEVAKYYVIIKFSIKFYLKLIRSKKICIIKMNNIIKKEDLSTDIRKIKQEECSICLDKISYIKNTVVCENHHPLHWQCFVELSHYQNSKMSCPLCRIHINNIKFIQEEYNKENLTKCKYCNRQFDPEYHNEKFCETLFKSTLKDIMRLKVFEELEKSSVEIAMKYCFIIIFKSKFGNLKHVINTSLERPEWENMVKEMNKHQCNSLCLSQCSVMDKTIRRVIKIATIIYLKNIKSKLTVAQQKKQICHMVMKKLKQKFNFSNKEVLGVKEKLLILIHGKFIHHLISKKIL